MAHNYELDLTDFLGRVLKEAVDLGVIDDPLAWMPDQPGEARIMGILREAVAQRDGSFTDFGFMEDRVTSLRIAMEYALGLDDECLRRAVEDALRVDDECYEPESEDR